jgi:putative transposase
MGTCEVLHQWLYLNQLNTIADVRRLTKFYVDEHNRELPHSAFQGQTPDEMYFGTGGQVVDELKTKRESARRRRLADNRRAACSACPRVSDVPQWVAA